MTKTRPTLAPSLAALLSLSLATGASAVGQEDEDAELAFCTSLVVLAESVAS